MTTPIRIRLSRAKGWRIPDNTTIVARPSLWGNPYRHAEPQVAASLYSAWVRGGLRTARMCECKLAIGGPLDERLRRIRAEVGMLRGRNLACWCALDAPCHADVLLDLANR